MKRSFVKSLLCLAVMLVFCITMVLIIDTSYAAVEIGEEMDFGDMIIVPEPEATEPILVAVVEPEPVPEPELEPEPEPEPSPEPKPVVEVESILELKPMQEPANDPDPIPVSESISESEHHLTSYIPMAEEVAVIEDIPEADEERIVLAKTGDSNISICMMLASLLGLNVCLFLIALENRIKTQMQRFIVDREVLTRNPITSVVRPISQATDVRMRARRSKEILKCPLLA